MCIYILYIFKPGRWKGMYLNACMMRPLMIYKHACALIYIYIIYVYIYMYTRVAHVMVLYVC